MTKSTWNIRAALAIPAAMTAGPTWAQPSVSPAAHLTAISVFANATGTVKLVMAGLAVVGVASIVVWLMEVARLRGQRGEPARPNTAFFSTVVIAGPLFGLSAAGYTLLVASLYISNGPAPTLGTLAPAIAEAAMTLTLGLFAAAIAATLRGHLQTLRGAGREHAAEPA
jgi:hypothetical protein